MLSVLCRGRILTRLLSKSCLDRADFFKDRLNVTHGSIVGLVGLFDQRGVVKRLFQVLVLFLQLQTCLLCLFFIVKRLRVFVQIKGLLIFLVLGSALSSQCLVDGGDGPVFRKHFGAAGLAPIIGSLVLR